MCTVHACSHERHGNGSKQVTEGLSYTVHDSGQEDGERKRKEQRKV